jgi:hypothetical protein
MSLPLPMPWKTNLHSDDNVPEETPRIICRTEQQHQKRNESGQNHSPFVDHIHNEQAEGSSARYDNNEHDTENENEEDDETLGHDLDAEIIHSIESFGAIVVPVSLTMILSALAVVFFNTEETLAAGEQAYAQTYEVIDLKEGNSSQNLGASLVNSLVLVSVICLVTILLVLLYKYRCWKIIYGYMVVVTTILLGYITSNMIIAAINTYGWPVDKLSFAFVMYNYAVVGTLAIFYQRGIPRWVTQGYLISCSVCLAWQFSYFSDWMAWTLLVMLAIYDLFAVLSPCGPLKALSNLISKPGSPPLPGLLYEANLPEGTTQKPKRKHRDDSEDNSNETRNTPEDEHNDSNGDGLDRIDETSRNKPPDKSSDGTSRAQSLNDCEHIDTMQLSDRLNRKQRSTSNQSQKQPKDAPQLTVHEEPTQSATPSERARDLFQLRNQAERPENLDTSNTGSIPLALAQLYNLSIMDPNGALRHRRFSSTWKCYYSSEEVREGSWTHVQKRSVVTAIFPPRGGVISIAEEQKYDDGVTYLVYNRLGEELRKFVVTRKGEVMQVFRRNPETIAQIQGTLEPSTIKLGLGDFVFYSVLVAKAAQYSFTTFVACFLVVLFGLAGTLVILAFKGKALPALPISIGLGVVFFLGTKEFVQPWIHAVLRHNLYV